MRSSGIVFLYPFLYQLPYLVKIKEHISIQYCFTVKAVKSQNPIYRNRLTEKLPFQYLSYHLCNRYSVLLIFEYIRWHETLRSASEDQSRPTAVFWCLWTWLWTHRSVCFSFVNNPFIALQECCQKWGTSSSNLPIHKRVLSWLATTVALVSRLSTGDRSSHPSFRPTLNWQ